MEAWEKLRRTDERDHGATLAHGRARQQRSMERDAHLLHLYHEHLHWAHFETRPMQTNLRNLLPRSPPPASTYSSTLHNQDHSFQSEDNREESHEREQQLARLHKWDHAERQRRQFAKLRYGRNAAFRLVNKWGVLSLPVSASPEQQSDRLQDWFPAFFDTMQLALSHYPGDEKHRRLSSEMRERGGAQLALLRETMQLIMADRKYASADELVRFFEHDRDSITDEKVGDHRRRPSPMDRLRNDSDTLAQVIYELARRQEWDAVERIWYLSLRRRPPPALRGHQPGAMNDGIAVAYLSAQIERCQPPSSARIRDEARRRAGSPWRQIGSSEGRILLSHQRSTHLRRVLAEVWTQQPYASTSSDDLGAALPVRTVPLISSRFLGKIFHVASVFPHACGRAILGLWADLLPSALDDGINSSNDTRDPEKVALSSRVLASALDLVAWNTSSALSGAPTDENIEGSGSLLPWRRKTDGSSTGPGHISAQTMRHLFRSLLFAQHPHLASMRTTPLEEVLHAERRRVGSSVGDHEFVSAGRRGRVASFFRKVLLSATVGESWMSRLTTAGPDEDGAENDKIVFPIAPAAPYRRDDDPPSTSSGRFFDDNANDLAVSDGQESNMHHQPQRPYINFDAEVFEKYALLLHVMTMPQSSVTFQPFHGDGQGRSGGPTAIRQFRLALGSPAGPAGQDSERGTSTTSSSSSAAPSSNFDSLLIKDQREEGAAAAAASTPVHPDEVLLVLTWMRALGLSPSKNLLCLLSVHLIETLPPGLMSSSSTQRASPSPLGPLSEWVAEWEKHVGVGGERGKGVVTRLSDDDVGRWLGRIRRKRAGARGRSNANRSWAG
ncbi:hypothetical protein OC846_001901 [Tilletia horrida]|uniref:Uncharacterized protein n=1 Tax=Tilletia horrida TaxID=155126 RepID=A0AAN6GS63_9BASI|nr:hypothetical protein OC846_001901 [Tilletia horrida]KAK0568338.1 hypothetical protein OC861_002049 [Tilletia horrida]